MYWNSQGQSIGFCGRGGGLASALSAPDLVWIGVIILPLSLVDSSSLGLPPPEVCPVHFSRAKVW